jgi:hypothetical protein
MTRLLCRDVAAHEVVLLLSAEDHIGRLCRWQAITVSCDFPFLPEANHLAQKLLSPVQSQAGHPFQVSIGEDRHRLFLLRSFLREVVRLGQDRQAPLRQRKKSVKWTSAAADGYRHAVNAGLKAAK